VPLEFEINIESEFGDKFSEIAKNYTDDYYKTLRVGIKQGLTIIAESARANHRFKNDTYNLQNRSILEDTEKIDQLIGAVKIDNVQASYGARIHQGFATWEPDPFIFNAGKREKGRVLAGIDKRLSRLNKG